VGGAEITILLAGAHRAVPFTTVALALKGDTIESEAIMGTGPMARAEEGPIVPEEAEDTVRVMHTVRGTAAQEAQEAEAEVAENMGIMDRTPDMEITAIPRVAADEGAKL